MTVTCRTPVRHEMSMRTLSRVEHINVEWLSGVNNEINCDEHRIQWRVPDDCIGYSCTNTSRGSENHTDGQLEGQAGKTEISHIYEH